jgi:hypothetical protein
MNVKLTNDEISRYLGIEPRKFEKYVSPIINEAHFQNGKNGIWIEAQME